MTSFVHVDYPAEHPGVVRAERAVELFRQGFRRTAHGSLLLAALVAAALVVANQVIDTWTDGHLLAAWIALWAVAFAGLALFAAPAARVATRLRGSLQGWSAERRQAEDDRVLRELALDDARVMADISRAMDRAAG